MAGIYLHIPFCKQACTYCNFHFSTSLTYKDELIRALIKEAEAEKDYLQGESVDTIYFGGGTPSLLDVSETESILNALHTHYPISSHPEITLEANPDDISFEKLRAWQLQGINRLSLGTQSFLEEELRWMNRAHNAEQALRSVEWSQAAGINNISIDLIYGSPLLSDKQWLQNVNTATGLNIPHLSCYALTVEEKTPLSQSIRKGKAPEVDPDKAARQFLMLMEWLREKGYEHYEVSNFAIPGKRSQHNTSYWKGIPYLGLGPSAHSYNGHERRWNIAHNSRYVKGLKDGLPPREVEVLTSIQQLNETIMIRLRTMEGLDLDEVHSKWPDQYLQQELGMNIKKGWMIREGNRFRLTDEGMLHADGIASDLFR